MTKKEKKKSKRSPLQDLPPLQNFALILRAQLPSLLAILLRQCQKWSPRRKDVTRRNSLGHKSLKKKTLPKRCAVEISRLPKLQQEKSRRRKQPKKKPYKNPVLLFDPAAGSLQDGQGQGQLPLRREG